MIVLTNPPPLNHIYRYTNRGVYKTHKAKAWQEEAAWEIKLSKPGHFKGEVTVKVEIYPPDKRRRDIDSSLKLLLDAIQDSGAIDDDYQVAELIVRRMEPDRKNPRLELLIDEIK